MRRIPSQSLLAFAAAVLTADVEAQVAKHEITYPTRAVRIVVGFTAGSSTDIIARLIGPRLAERWGQPVVIDNRAGAGGVAAGSIVAKANPDGHTLMVIGSGFPGSAALHASLPYDSIEDFSGVTQILSTPLVLVVSPALGVKSVKELIALAKTKPGHVSFGSTGLGSGTHYGAELFKLAARIDAVHVPYRGSPQALTDTMSGRVQFFMSPILPVMPLIKVGKALALGVTSLERAPTLPEVPTISEAALPGFEYQGWGGLLAPGRTPRAIIRLLSGEVGRILEHTEVREQIANQGGTVRSSTPEAFDQLIRNEIASRRRVWQAAGVRVE